MIQLEAWLISSPNYNSFYQIWPNQINTNLLLLGQIPFILGKPKSKDRTARTGAKPLNTTLVFRISHTVLSYRRRSILIYGPYPRACLKMLGGRAIHRLLGRKFQSEYTASPILSSIVSKKAQEECGSFGMKSFRTLALIGAGVSGLVGFATAASADEAEHGLECPNYPWPHEGILSSYDHASIRRGHQVYQQVCASCHSMSLVSYRDLVGVAYTEEEVKAMAAEIEVEDGPNDEGEMFTRPGKLSDRFPQPYSNEAAARFANGGAYPPDLSLITKARHNGQNYVFALLTGYRDPPAGVSIREGLHYNPYFPGGAIAMPKMLNDGAVEYEDGTPATEAQMGKDVVSFLTWAAEPEMEERKLMGFKWIFVLSLALLQAAYYRRLRWSVLKSRKLVLDVVN
ncbi:hypothetical protein K7X08_019127 [Anisodus acutangulus]|uniref:Cytochrome c domain-containing protein n=1 Tax=Anisodus acutangulus TaxID=402998 RepID=A0A9Q1MV84_9SOLA|nr:hypothetical protein K7X08_019127 [Anisodus acutangulus]